MSQTQKTTEKKKIRESKVSRTSKTINVQFPQAAYGNDNSDFVDSDSEEEEE